MSHSLWVTCLVLSKVYLVIGMIGRLAGEDQQQGGPTPEEEQGGPFIQFNGNSGTLNTFRSKNGKNCIVYQYIYSVRAVFVAF